MKIALFVPCYVDQFFPEVAKASLQLLQKLGCEVDMPPDQTCCGQPLANSGMEQEAKAIYHHFVKTFDKYDYIVAPSASCVYHVKHHYDVIPQTEEVRRIRANTVDICSFLADTLQVKELDAKFPHKVGIHQSCHGLRGLQMARPTELMIPPFSTWRSLLDMVQDIEIVPLDRMDECCGFGGTFAINEEAVSVKMGQDRIRDHEKNGASFITSGDMSCLMHMQGIIRRESKPLQVIHIVEILNGIN